MTPGRLGADVVYPLLFHFFGQESTDGIQQLLNDFPLDVVEPEDFEVVWMGTWGEASPYVVSPETTPRF